MHWEAKGRNRGMKWYVKFLKEISNVSIHNAYITYKSTDRINHLTYRLDFKEALILTVQLLSPERGFYQEEKKNKESLCFPTAAQAVKSVLYCVQLQY
jgi:hypothetical protein